MSQKDFLIGLITLTLLLNLWSSPTLAQIAPISLQNVIWEPANEPYDGHIKSLLVTPAGSLVAGTDGGIFRSVDTGETWTEVNKGLSSLTSPIVRALTVSGSTLFAGTDEGLFRSIDDGNSWTLVSPNLRAVIQALASSRFSIFAGTDDRGVFRSTDSGNSWTQVNSGLTNPTVYALAKFRGTLFAGTNGGGIFRSSDNGETWIPVNKGLTNTIVYSLAISGSGKTVLAGTLGGVFRSSDDGETWTQVGKGLITAKVLSLAILRDIPATIFAGTEGQGIFRSTDNGNSWNRADTGLTNPLIPALAILEKTVFAGSDGNGIFRSADNGQTWAAINLGLTNVNVLSLAASRKIPSIIFASTDGGGVFRSLDGGHTWNPVNAGLTNTVIPSLALAETGSNPNIATIFAGTNGGGVFSSLDNGNSWTPVNKGLLNPNVLALAIAETSATTVAIFAGTNGGGVFKSLDNGNSWTPVNKGLSHMAVSALTIAGKSLFAGTDGGGVFRSLDNGNSWTPVNIGLTNLAVNALVSIETNLFAGTNGGGVFRSSDNGDRWTPVNTGLTSPAVNVLATSGVDIFAGTNGGGVFRSTDNGEVWTQVNESLGLDRGLTHIIVSSLASSGASVFAGVTGGKVFRASIKIKVISDPPSIISLSPERLSQGLSSQKISISGANFQPEARIIFSGSGISVNAVAFDRSTQLTVDINLAPNADLGLRDIILINPDGGSFKKTKAFTVIRQLLISSFNPGSLEQGAENRSLSIIGDNFQEGAKVTFSGKGLDVKAVTFDSPKQLRVNLNLASDAELGLRDVTITNPDGAVATKIGAFKIISAPAITALNPPSLPQGAEDKSLAISGDKFQLGISLAFSGSGIVIKAVDFDSPKQLSVELSLDSEAELGLRDITLTNPDGGEVTKAKAFTVISAPIITSLSPASMTLAEGTDPLGKKIAILGAKFQKGATLTFSGSGITVDKVVFDNPAQLTATIRIDPNAELSLRDLTLTNPDGGSVRKAEAFSLISSPAITALNPAFAPQGVENRIISLLGANFQFGVSLTFSGAGVRVNSVAFESASQLTLSLSIASNAEIGLRDISVTNPDGGKVAKSQAFNVVIPPLIKALSPASLFQGAENKSLIITGDKFQSQAKVAFSGSGITVNSVVFNTATQLTVIVSLEPQADVGLRDLIVTNPDGGEAAKSQAFTVAAIPLITALSPASLAQDSINKTITISGNFFQKGAKVAFSGGGISLGSVTVDSEAQLSFNVNIAANAEAGLRDVAVTNPDGGSFTKTKAFTVISVPVIIILNPAFSPQGSDSKLIQILGDNFQKGATVAFSGSGVAVNSVSFDSAKQLTVDINVAPNADLGFRDITVANPDGGSHTKSEAFKVALASLITSISPNVLAQGSENKSLTIAGDNFQKGAVVVFSGSGINVNSISYDSATQLTVNISISPKAEAGSRDVTIINPDGVSRTKSGAFSVIQSVALANVSVTAFPRPPIADGKSTVIIRFNLKDANDKPVSGKEVKLTISGSGNVLNPTQPIPTDAGGQTRVALTSTKAETKTITASVEGVNFSTEVTFAPDVVSATKSTVSAVSPVAADSLSGSTVTLVLKDQHENLISHRNFKVSVSIEPSDGVSIIPASPASSFTKVTDANGSLNFAVKSTKAELRTLKVAVSEATASGAAVSPSTATTTAAETALQPPEAPAIAIDGVALQSAPTIEFKAGAPEVIIVTSDKAETLTGQAVKIKATVEDKYKNPIKDAKLTISALFESGATEIISPVVNHNDGSYSAAYQPKSSGKASLKATATDTNKFGVATITVSHVNRAPTAIKLSNSTISETSLNDAEVGVLTTVDPDLDLNVGEAHSYQLKLKEDAAGRFKIVDDRLLVAKSWLLDFETAKSHQITVLSADRGNLTIEQAISITVSDASETPISISSIVPAYGLISGGSVEIRGENFASGVAVFIGEKLAEVAVFTPSQLGVSLPPGKLGAAEVKVINPGNNFALIPEGFTYVTNPIVNRIVPSGGALSGGAEVKIEGEHFSANLKLTFGGVEATEVKRISATEILAKTPPLEPKDPKASPGSVAVDVMATNLDTGLTGTLLQGFRYLPAPVATKIQPAEGTVAGGGEVLITGEHFSLQSEPKTMVFIGGKEAAQVVVLSEKEIRAQTPPAPAGVTTGTAEVVVTTPGGRSKPLAGGFTYTSQLILRAISPKEGPTSGSTLISLKGENFEKELTVEIGGLKATEVVFRSKTEVLAKTPAAKDELSRASVEVKVQNPDGKTASLEAAFTYIPPPRITKVTPNQAPSNAPISIMVQNFDPKATVSLGQKKVNIIDIDIIKVSPTEMEIQLKTPPSEAGVVDITVKNPDGQSDTLAKGFSYTKSILFEVKAGKPFEKELSAPDGKPLGKLSIEIPTGSLPSEATGKPIEISIEAFEVADAAKLADKLKAQGFELKPNQVVGNVVFEIEVKTETGAALTEFREPIAIRIPYDPTRLPLPNVLLVSDVKSKKFVPIETVRLEKPPVLIGTLSHLSFVTPGLNQAPTATAPALISVAGAPLNIELKGSDPDGDALSFSITQLPANGSLYEGQNGQIPIFSVPFSLSSNKATYTPKAEYFGKDSFKFQVFDGAATSASVAVEIQISLLAPKLTSVTPNKGSASGGTQLTLKGENFVSETTVSIGNQKATSVNFISTSEIQAVAPAYSTPAPPALASPAGTKVEAMVANPDGKSATLSAGFTYYPPPKISAILPKSGSMLGGAKISISGANFIVGEGAEVRFGTTLATEVTVVSETQITAKTPAGAPGAIDVVVTTAGGTSKPLTAGFTYIPSPLILSLSSTRLPKGGGPLTITGENFATDATVSIGGKAATEVNVSETQITLIAPAAAEGSIEIEADLVVTNPDGQAATLKAGVVYVTDPIVSRIEPLSGAMAGGTVVTLFGANFVKGTAVTFGGVAAQAKTVSEKGDMMMVVIPPASLPKEAPFSDSFSVEVMVKNPDGKLFTLLGGFTYLAPPLVFAIEPATGSVAGGTPITIIGSNFKNGANVRLGEAIATEAQLLSSTKITAITPKIPEGIKPGAADVIVINPDGQEGQLTAGFSYLILPPIIASMTPTFGPVSGGTVVTLRGENFNEKTTVSLGGQAAAEVTFASPTQLSFMTPPNKTKVAEAVDIIVANPDGDGQATTLSAGFNYVTIPIIASVFPNNGSTQGGSLIRLKGANFLNGASVIMVSTDGQKSATATEVKVVSDLELTAKTPPFGVGTVEVVVKNPGGAQWTLIGGFTYLEPPEVRFITPDTGATLGGTAITIEGSNFKAGAQLQIGDQLASEVAVLSDVKITAVTKASTPGSFDVILTNPNGLKGTLKGGFSYVIAPPIITGIAPNKGSTTGGIPISIRGENFVSGASLKLGGQQFSAEAVNVLSATQISFLLPAGTIGAVDIAIANPDGQSATIEAGFTYVTLPPEISAILPDSGSTTGETAISIFGENFASGATVSIGGLSATQVSVTPTKITALTPPGVEGKADVSVTNPDGGSKTLKAGFNYFPVVPEKKQKAEAEAKRLETEKKKAESEIKNLEAAKKDAEAEGETEEVKKLEAAIKKATEEVKKLEATQKIAEAEVKRLENTPPPVITLVDTDNQAIAGSPKLIKAKIILPLTAASDLSFLFSSAPAPNPISAKLFFLTGGKSFSVVDMTPMGAGTGSENLFVGSIPASAITLSGAAYYIKATNFLGQSSFFPPEAATNPKKAMALNVIGDIIGPEIESNGSFTQTALPAWKGKADWTMISFPFELPNDDPNAIFSDLGKVEAEWQVYRYEGGADLARAIALKRPGHLKGDIEKFDSIQRGNAAWIYSAKGGSISLKGARATNPLAPFPIRVYSGLNMIGNPFRFLRFWNAETVKFSTMADGSDAVDILTAAAANKLSPILYLKPVGSSSYLKLSADPSMQGADLVPYPGKFEPWKGYLFIAKVDGYLWIDPTTAGPSTGMPSAAPIYAQIQRNRSLTMVKVDRTLLLQNYPNPFNPETWIPYQLSEAAEVKIRIFDVSGRLIRSLNLGRQEMGLYLSKERSAYWDGRNESRERVSSGVYLYELTTGSFRAVKKMVILK